MLANFSKISEQCRPSIDSSVRQFMRYRELIPKTVG